jgi:hypothetical protein
MAGVSDKFESGWLTVSVFQVFQVFQVLQVTFYPGRWRADLHAVGGRRGIMKAHPTTPHHHRPYDKCVLPW